MASQHMARSGHRAYHIASFASAPAHPLSVKPGGARIEVAGAPARMSSKQSASNGKRVAKKCNGSVIAKNSMTSAAAQQKRHQWRGA
jgi:hypothetical protein